MNDMATTTMEGETTLVIRRLFRCDIHTLWSALTSAEGIRNWFGPGSFAVTHTASEVRPGGKWVIEMANPEGAQHNVGGEYVEIEAPNRAVFTWAWQNEPNEVSQVTYALHPADGGTTLILTHKRLPSANSRDMHGHGWNGALDKLAPWVAR